MSAENIYLSTLPSFQVPGVDFQHAVIEYSEKDDCFIIQDLNTAQGTYVNDVRVQNAAVRLAAGDCVRFGYNGIPYELQVEQTSMVSFTSKHYKLEGENTYIYIYTYTLLLIFP